MIIKTGRSQNVQILVDKPPKFLGVPLKKFILAYHVIFLVLLIKEMHDRVLPPVPLIIMAWITVVSFFLIKSKQKTYIKIHFWISLAFLIAVLLMMMFAVFYEYITGNQSFLRHFSTDSETDIITAVVVLIMLGLYSWVCYKFNEHLSKVPEILPRHSQDVVHVQLTTRY